MSRQESEWSELFAQWLAAYQAGDTEQEAELWNRLRSVSGDGTGAIMAWARSLDRAELSAALEQFETAAGERGGDSA